MGRLLLKTQSPEGIRGSPHDSRLASPRSDTPVARILRLPPSDVAMEFELGSGLTGKQFAVLSRTLAAVRFDVRPKSPVPRSERRPAGAVPFARLRSRGPRQRSRRAAGHATAPSQRNPPSPR